VDCRRAGAARDGVADWLRRQPWPVIALGDVHPLAAAADVIAAGPELPALAAAVAARPQAALVLVQLLRASEGLAVAQALTLESLAFATLQGGAEFRAWLAARTPPAPPPAQAGPAVLVTRDGDRLDIRLNRPASHNALSVPVRDALAEALELAASDTALAVTLSGAGRCFSVGGDLGEFGQVPDPATGHVVRSLRLPAARLALCAGRTTARVHGACIGAGVEIAAFAGRVVAAPDSFFQLPELRFGLIPGAGGCVSLPRRIGRQRTAWLALTGRRITARTALAWGLVDAVSPAR
jgi:enoyl-CoA hydratase/carnithine racemase